MLMSEGALSHIMAHVDIALDKALFLSIFFLFLNKNICCGCSLEAPLQGTSNEYPQHVFMEK